ncbi:MAG TPA: alpha/beta fold hydrolase [Bacteroidales bacterium]|mgnify:FL=1|nr:alpha/beta fold hydrolase [Bacteroidales bacterium]HQC60389.1 alpha/beta fold hydrolase [Bacteroidales bacterium]HQM78090.1 alpha/beta fold hydrolase [Bacteroidales bacterium]
MKNIIFTFIILLNLTLSAQELQGYWQGQLNNELQKINMQFAFSYDSSRSSYIAYLTIPQQMIIRLKINKISVADDSIKINISNFAAKYHGKIFDNDSIIGNWYQSGMSLPLILYRISEVDTFSFNRPQNPLPPFPYISKDVEFYNKKDKIKLAGTITIPDSISKHPAVVLISGSGPQDRDESLAFHKPFALIADRLTKAGIVVLRYDDRGVAKSEGNFSIATTFDFADDAKAAINWLKNQPFVDKNNIGVIGHSEGGIIAFYLASKEKNLKFAIALAGVTIPCDQLIALQTKKMMQLYDMPTQITEAYYNFYLQALQIIKTETNDKWKNILDSLFNANFNNLDSSLLSKYNIDKSLINQLTFSYNNIWLKTFINIDPSDYLKNLNCNTLALFGSKDVQVPAAENEEMFKQIAMCKKKSCVVESMTFEGLNHLFQHANTGSTEEYALIEETMSDDVLETIINWIQKNIY